MQVLNVQDLGPLEATTLTADDPAALDGWLTEHDYRMSEEFEQLVGPYVDEGWAFVAVRLTIEGEALDGALPPLEVTFDSDALVYPMRMSQGATVTQRTRTYVLAEHKVERTDPTAPEGSGADTAFAGLVDLADVQSDLLRESLAQAPYLTTIDQTFSDPAESITSDFTFGTAADDQPYQQVYYTDTYLVPVDVAILVGLAVVGLTGAGLWALRRRPR